MSMMTGERRSIASEINVTPLIDVLLVLLIIFMVILPAHYRGEMTQIPQPPPDNLAKNPEEPICIQLADTGESKAPNLTINGKAVAWDGLEARLQSIYSARVDRVAFLKGDPGIDFEYVAQAIDIAHRAGAFSVGLLGKND